MLSRVSVVPTAFVRRAIGLPSSLRGFHSLRMSLASSIDTARTRQLSFSPQSDAAAPARLPVAEAATRRAALTAQETENLEAEQRFFDRFTGRGLEVSAEVGVLDVVDGSGDPWKMDPFIQASS